MYIILYFMMLQPNHLYMDDIDPESGDAMDAILNNAHMLGTYIAKVLTCCWINLLPAHASNVAFGDSFVI